MFSGRHMQFYPRFTRQLMFPNQVTSVGPSSAPSLRLGRYGANVQAESLTTSSSPFPLAARPERDVDPKCHSGHLALSVGALRLVASNI
jgi:hypothetical protein